MIKNNNETNNFLFTIKNKNDFRQWLNDNCQTEKECWIIVKRGKPIDENHFWYIDAVETALCFGWIDSIWKNIDGNMWSKFTPRQKKSPWTELNKERVRRLEKLGLMTENGRKVLPNMDKNSFIISQDIENALKQSNAWETFISFPKLYQRIRAYNVHFYYNKDKKTYEKALKHLIEMTKLGKMYGEWNDYGRLL